MSLHFVYLLNLKGLKIQFLYIDLDQVIGYDPHFAHDNKIEIRVKEKIVYAEFKQEKTNFLPGKQFEYALGNNMYNRCT